MIQMLHFTSIFRLYKCTLQASLQGSFVLHATMIITPPHFRWADGGSYESYVQSVYKQ